MDGVAGIKGGAEVSMTLMIGSFRATASKEAERLNQPTASSGVLWQKTQACHKHVV